MKKLLLLILMVCSIGTKAQEIRDYVFASALQYDASKSLYYFDVNLEGDNYYVGYGMDIQLPVGLEVNATTDRKGTKPNIVILEEGMYEDEYGSTEHFVTPSFPYPDDHTHARVGCLSTGNYDMGKTSGPLFRVYVNNTYTSGWPVGSIKLFAVELGKVGSHHNPADREDIVLIHTGETNLPLSVSATAHWGTCILPFNAELPAGVKAYTCTENDEESIYLENASSMEAYTPYILYSEDGYKGTISGIVDTQKYPETGYVKKGLLNGAIVDQSISDGYILQNLSGGVMFYPIKEGSTFNIPAGKCWMTLPSTANAQGMNFVVNDPASIKNIGITDDDNSIYTLQGIKVENGVKGSIYIKSGKKFIAK